MQERDHEYHSHLRLLKERVVQLENELASTQKFAGMRVKLPYERAATYNGGGQLSPPELLKQPPVTFKISSYPQQNRIILNFNPCLALN